MFLPRRVERWGWTIRLMGGTQADDRGEHPSMAGNGAMACLWAIALDSSRVMVPREYLPIEQAILGIEL